MKRVIKFLFFAALTGFFFYVLEKGIKIGATKLPPLGKLTHPNNGYLYNAAYADKGYDQNITLDGVKDEITIVYDDRLVPHIYARNQEDLFFCPRVCNGTTQVMANGFAGSFSGGQVV